MLGVTIGDANGVGPEILIRAVASGAVTAPFLAYGDAAVLEYAADRLDLPVIIERADARTADHRRPSEGTRRRVRVVDTTILTAADITPGTVSRAVGSAAVEYVDRATRDALAGLISGIVTLPINKEASRLSRTDFSGHTEFIAQICGNPPVTMMLVSDRLIVTHVSTHVALREAIERATSERILEVIRLTDAAVKRLRARARIAVAGLNPHAGEHGAFGTEDDGRIRPAIEDARAEGIDAYGPEPADTVFFNTVHRDRFDAVVCMYHDQGHIPIKTLDFDGGVNVTLGLPIIRTSVDHGTAYDIADKGVAATRSFELAFALAEKLMEHDS